MNRKLKQILAILIYAFDEACYDNKNQTLINELDVSILLVKSLIEKNERS